MLAPPIVKTVEVAEQIVTFDESVRTGREFTVTVVLVVLEQPKASVPLTV